MSLLVIVVGAMAVVSTVVSVCACRLAGQRERRLGGETGELRPEPRAPSRVPAPPTKVAEGHI
jgi:hypothetical protein